MISKKYYQVVSFLIIIAAVYYSFSSVMPSEKIKEQTDVTEFSTERALVHLKNITQNPHFTSSEEHNVVRNYIVNELEKLGLVVEIQEQQAINKKWRSATNTKNIITKIKGSENGKALLLLSHYDSNPHSSLGASDAGSGVVVILEGIRAFLAKNKQPKNDIIICITDAEELGLLGANAFVNHHTLASNIGLVVNFEARGSGGPSYMLLETNGGNKNLIEAFHQANATHPVGNSLMYSIYKMLPNDTDLTVFRENRDIDGFNFAFIGDHFDYHTAQDSFERMDFQSFLHQVSYLTATLNYFANSDLNNLKAEEDLVYFNFPYLGLVFYPFSWITPMLVSCFILFIVLIFIGFLEQKLTLVGILKGFIPLLLSLIFSGLFTFYGWKILVKIHPQYQDILHGFTYNGYWYIAGFTSVVLAICFWFYKGFFKKRALQDLVIAPLFFWLVLNVVIALYLKGAAFFIAPVIILLTILSIFIFSKSNQNLIFLITVLSIPVIIIFTPFIKMFPVGLGLKMLIISAFFTVMLFGFLVPVFQQYSMHKKLVYIFILIGGMCFISASSQSSYSTDRRKPNSINYVLDADTYEAFWASYNKDVDVFTEQFLGKNPSKGSYDKNIIASKYKTNIKLHTKAPIKLIEKPAIEIVLDSIIGDDKIIVLKIISLRNANKIELLSKIPIQFKSIEVNGELLKNNNNNLDVLSIDNGTILSYFRTAKDEIVNLEFVVNKNQQFDIDILEIKYDLLTNPNFNIKERSDYMMPMPFVTNDATIVKTNIKF